MINFLDMMDLESQLGSFDDRNNFTRFRYPNDYKKIISITKFERDFLKKPNESRESYGSFTNQTLLTYKFIDAFPVNINAVPLTYEVVRLLRCQLDLII